jgi:hypothetical protein
MRAVLRRVVAVLALVAAAAGTGAAVAPAPARAAASRAVIVIGSNTYTISFNGTITGLQALQMVASVETLGYSGQGSAVCTINGAGNPAVPGECLGEKSGQYWSYWRSPPGSSGWTYAGTGAASSSVTDGSVEGWNLGQGQPPPYHSFCATAGCAPPPPPPTSPPPGGGTNTAAENGTTTATKLDGTPADRDTGTTSTSAARGNDDDGADSEEQASDPPRGGRPEIEAGDDGSPIGLAVAGGLIAALGCTGLWFRRRGRAVP